MLVYLNGPELLCDISAGLPRSVAPSDFRCQVFDIMHNLAHPGKKTTQILISGTFVRYGLKKQVKQWAKECLVCQRSKIQRHIHAPPETFDMPEKRFSYIHIHLVGSIPLSSRFTTYSRSWIYIIVDQKQFHRKKIYLSNYLKNVPVL